MNKNECIRGNYRLKPVQLDARPADTEDWD